MQTGSVKLFDTFDGGQINVQGGLIQMDGGLETAVYLSLFGGNEDDDGAVDSLRQFWGNWTETDTQKQYRSRTQNFIDSKPASSANLRLLEDYIVEDLAWMVPDAASEVTATAALVSVKRVDIIVSVVVDGARSDFKFSANWEVSL